MFARSKRELSHPGYFTLYRWFWRGCKWDRFLLSNKGGFALARQHVSFLEARPGVYELAISKGSNRKYKVYIGESGSIRKRHQAYAVTGSNLLAPFDAALRDGCTVWQRCRYVKTKGDAVAWESYFLKRYDYAWNAQQNQRKRFVSIVSRHFCMCMPSTSIVEEHAITANSAL